MKVTTERLEHCQINVFVELEAAEVDEKLRQTARKISQKVSVRGYRKGHAPFAAVIRAFGREAVQHEAIDEVGQELYDAALKEIPYEPYQQGELQKVDWDPFRMTVLIPIRPEVELGDYREVRLPLEPEPVTEEQLEKRVADIQQEQAQWVPVERPAELGDQVVIAVEGQAGDKEVLKQEEAELLLEEGATAPAPGFHQQIVGLSAGEEKSFSLSYPEDYAEKDLAGKEAAFHVRVNAVKQKELPPLDDELAMMVGTYDTLGDLKVSVRQQLETEAIEKALPLYLDKMLEALVEKAAKIDYPPQAVNREVERATERLETNLASSGIKLERYLQIMGKTPEAYQAELRPPAVARLKKRLVMIEVAKKEGLKISEAEIEAEVARLNAMLREDAEDLRTTLNSPEGRLSVADDLLTGQVQARIIEIGRGEAPPLEEAPAEEEESAGTAPQTATEVSQPDLPASADLQEAPPETPGSAEALAAPAPSETSALE